MTDEHKHTWSRRQNVTTKGYVMPAIEVCGCGAARHVPAPAEPDADEREASVLCPCGHRVTWHHDTRGCGYFGHAEDRRCPCLLDSDAVVAHLLAAAAKAEGHALRERLIAAEQRLTEVRASYPYWQKDEIDRLSGKAEGVRLALSYVEETARLREQGGE